MEQNHYNVAEIQQAIMLRNRDTGDYAKEFVMRRQRFFNWAGAIDGQLADLACGEGRCLAELRASGISIVGAELDPRFYCNYIFPTDGYTYPFDDDSLNAIISCWGIFNYSLSEEMLIMNAREVGRMLQRGGKLLTTLYITPRPIVQIPIEQYTLFAVSLPDRSGTLGLFPLIDIICKEGGFTIVKRRIKVNTRICYFSVEFMKI